MRYTLNSPQLLHSNSRFNEIVAKVKRFELKLMKRLATILACNASGSPHSSTIKNSVQITGTTMLIGAVRRSWQTCSVCGWRDKLTRNPSRALPPVHWSWKVNSSSFMGFWPSHYWITEYLLWFRFLPDGLQVQPRLGRSDKSITFRSVA